MLIEFESEDQQNKKNSNEDTEVDPNDQTDIVIEPEDDTAPEPEIDTENNSDIESDTQIGSILDIKYVPRADELRAILSAITADANELERLNRFSDPNDFFARSRKTELQARLSEKFQQLQEYLSLLEKEVLRCKKNLSILQTDSQRLNLVEPQGYYSEAEQQQLKQLHQAISDRDAVSWTITKVRSALSSTSIGDFPGRYPFKPDSTSPSSVPEYRSPDKVRLPNEIKDMLSSGPLVKDKG